MRPMALNVPVKMLPFDNKNELLLVLDFDKGTTMERSDVAVREFEVYGQPDHSYEDLLLAADAVRARLAIEPGVVDVDHVREAAQPKLIFATDKEKAALNGITTEQVAGTLRSLLEGGTVGLMRSQTERKPLRIELRVPMDRRTSAADLARVQVKVETGQLVPLAELGRWDTARVDQMIYHKNLQRLAYVFAETAGRPPADVVVDVLGDESTAIPAGTEVKHVGNGWMTAGAPRAVAGRTFFSNGSNVHWGLPAGFTVGFAGEGEWKITLDVFRDLGLAFGAAMIAIYVLLVAQMGSFTIPIVVMLAIPLTILGVMPGFWLLNALNAQQVGGFLDPVYFTATGMIGMIALSGIVTRDSIILVDFIHLSLARKVAIRRHHGKPRGAIAADPADGLGRDAGGRADHHRPHLFRAGLVADLRPAGLDSIYAVRDPGGLLAALRP